jgi:DNA-binding MarR family transcriptional regulator
MDLSRSLVALAVRSLGAIDGAVTLPQFRALAVLERIGPCNAGQLAAGVGLHVSSITRLCDRLVAAQLLTREVRPDNRREVELRITTSGSDLVHTVWSARATELGTALRGLSADQRTALRQVVPALLDVLGDPSTADAWG